MKDYFVLQLKMSNRHFSDSGIYPVVGYLLAAAGFAVLSFHLFSRTDWARYLIVLLCLGVLLSASGKPRNDFLLIAFGEKKKRAIRVIENVLLSSPFATALLANGAILETAMLLLLALVLGLFLVTRGYSVVIPTPFSKHLFEFTMGFRGTTYLLLIAYALTLVSIIVGNEVVGLFALVVIFLVCSSYYLKPEDRHWVWVFSGSPRDFLLRKMLMAFRNAAILLSPVILGLMVFHRPHAISVVMVSVIGLFFLWTVVLAKYAAFPREPGLAQGALIGLCFIMPPLLFLVLAYFYLSASQNLSVVLND